jgi:hypothetical protein
MWSGGLRPMFKHQRLRQWLQRQKVENMHPVQQQKPGEEEDDLEDLEEHGDECDHNKKPCQISL